MLQHQRQLGSGGTTTLVVENSGPPKLPQGGDKQTTPQPAAEVQSHDVSSPQLPTSSTDGHVNNAVTANTQTPSGAKLLDIDTKKNGAAVSAEQGLCLAV